MTIDADALTMNVRGDGVAPRSPHRGREPRHALAAELASSLCYWP